MFVKIDPALDQTLAVLESAGFIRSFHPLVPPSTIFIDLTKSEMGLWEQISRSGKYSIQRARREGSRIETHQSPSEKILEDFRLVAPDTARVKNILPPPL